jgi:PKD repeat protein
MRAPAQPVINNMKVITIRSILALCAALAASCTMKNQEAPPLTGPSEFSTSISVGATPDVLPTDGGSQALVTITAFDANGAPLRNVSLRTEINVNGTAADFGTLSARNVVTDANGRATLVYTAPLIQGGVDTGTIVNIGVTPVGTNFANAVTRTTSIRLVPTGVVIPPDGLQPDFTFTPSNPNESQNVFFDGTSSRSPALNPIASYRWDFGDGGSAVGSTANHVFRDPGTFVVRLTISDALGRSAFTTKTVTVGSSPVPTASFVVSPTNPSVNQGVNFNGAASAASAGRKIVSYTWDFGDGTPLQTTGGPVANHGYSVARTYTVTLTVTDDIGRTNSTSRTVTVTP